jgi:hypothetical protein
MANEAAGKIKEGVGKAVGSDKPAPPRGRACRIPRRRDSSWNGCTAGPVHGWVAPGVCQHPTCIFPFGPISLFAPYLKIGLGAAPVISAISSEAWQGESYGSLAIIGYSVAMDLIKMRMPSGTESPSVLS